MKRPCDIKIDNCPGVDVPVTNTSAEDPDPLIFAGFGFIQYDPFGIPPLGNGLYTARDCSGVEYSVESQELADLLALLNSRYCNTPNAPLPSFAFNPRSPSNTTTTPGCNFFTNDRQEATAFCNDGTTFTFEVAAGTVISACLSQADGERWVAATNAQIRAYCEQKVNAQKICLSGQLQSGCENVFYSDIIFASQSDQVPVEATFSILNGSLPPGLEMVPMVTGVQITGTPTTPGNFNFEIRAELPGGLSVQKVYTIAILGFLAALPDAQVNVAYSQSLNPSGGVAPYTMTILSGTWPTGLTMTPGGVVSGTPTVIQTKTLTLLMVDANNASCVHDVTLAVTACGTIPQTPATLSWSPVAASSFTLGAFTVLFSPTRSWVGSGGNLSVPAGQFIGLQSGVESPINGWGMQCQICLAAPRTINYSFHITSANKLGRGYFFGMIVNGSTAAPGSNNVGTDGVPTNETKNYSVLFPAGQYTLVLFAAARDFWGYGTNPPPANPDGFISVVIS